MALSLSGFLPNSQHLVWLNIKAMYGKPTLCFLETFRTIVLIIFQCCSFNFYCESKKEKKGKVEGEGRTEWYSKKDRQVHTQGGKERRTERGGKANRQTDIYRE
jgi:hypothetical protein